MTMELLSRLQFAFTVSFHILFPAFSIGLSTFLMIMEATWLITKKDIYLNITRFWLKVFALTFGMGVVSGIVMEFQFGTNWAGFSAVVGPVLGALFTYEVLTAFFIEAGALGIMLFGWGRVNKYVHFAATFIIFIGVTLSAFWILSANSWMQTPAGATYEQGRFIIHNWLQVIFNPSVFIRYTHMLIAAYISTALIISGVSAFYLVRNKHQQFSKKCLSFALWALLFLSFSQVIIGDDVGREVHHNQPIKTAAIEGVWHTQYGAPLLLFAWPNMTTQQNDFAIGIPKLASLINTHKMNGKLIGLDSVPAKDRPYAPIVFWSFRIMVGIGLLIALVSLIGLALRLTRRLYRSPWFYRLLIPISPLGFVALLTGWYTAEVGRQPWVIYGIVRTADAVSDLKFWQVASSISAIILIYILVFGVFYLRYLLRIFKTGPTELGTERMPFAYFQAHDDETLQGGSKNA